MTEIRIAPSILAADFTKLGEQIRDAEAAGADRIHIDVIDGRYAPNITFGPLIVEAVRRVTNLPLDVHLMILEPDKYLPAFAEAGANHLSVHWETSPHLHRTLQTIKQLGCRPGLAINPHMPASFLSEIMHLLEIIIVMSVNPGFGGQTFIPEVLPKITHLRRMIDNTGRTIDLEVDGGVNEETVGQIVAAGADVLIAGNSIFNNKFTVAEGIAKLRRASV